MSFSKELALKLAELSELSYSKSTFEKDKCSFYLEETESEQFLAFRGSYYAQNWLDDMETFKVKRNRLGEIHNGVADYWDKIKVEVIKHLDRTKKLYITGHSLGGGVGSVAALYLHNAGYKIESLYTFGSLRVGNSEWKKNFQKSGLEYFRVVNGDDIISKIPKLFYFHVGREVLINRRAFFSWLHDNFTDHLISKYIENIQKMG